MYVNCGALVVKIGGHEETHMQARLAFESLEYRIQRHPPGHLQKLAWRRARAASGRFLPASAQG